MRFALLAMLIVTSPAGADNLAGCVPAHSLPAWVELRMKYRGTSAEADVEALWRTRLDLCEQHRRGEISPEEAGAAFERARSELMRKWEEETGAAGAG